MSYVIEPASSDEAIALLSSDKKPVLVDFFATWCGPCLRFSPVLEQFAADKTDIVQVLKIDVEQFSEIAQKAGIRGVPTLMVIKNGQVIATQPGALTKSDLEMFVDRALGRAKDITSPT